MSKARGTANVLYLADDTLRVFLNVAQPCQLRLIYRDADNHLLLLLQDSEIQARQLNQWQPVAPDKTFVVSGPPFGPEHLIAYVSDVPFAPLRTHKQSIGINLQGREEYIILIDDDLGTVKKRSTTGGSVAEQLVKITTRRR